MGNLNLSGFNYSIPIGENVQINHPGAVANAFFSSQAFLYFFTEFKQNFQPQTGFYLDHTIKKTGLVCKVKRFTFVKAGAFYNLNTGVAGESPDGSTDVFFPVLEIGT